MKGKYKLLFLFFAIGIILSILLVYGCKQQNKLVLQGYIEGKYTYLASAVAGKLDELYVDRGDQVKSGQAIFVLDKEPELSQLQKAKQTLLQAQQTLADVEKGQRQTILNRITAEQSQAAADLDYSSKTLARYKKLYSQRVIDKDSLDRAQSDYDLKKERVKEAEANLSEAKLGARENFIKAQQATVAAANADVKQTQWALDQKTMFTPYDALVFDKSHEVGEFIAAGDPVVILLPQDTLKVIFFIPERNLSQIQLGEKIEFGCDGCKQHFPATISFISSNAEFTPPVIFSFESREKLVYRVEAKITLNIAKQLHTGQPVDVFINLEKGLQN